MPATTLKTLRQPRPTPSPHGLSTPAARAARRRWTSLAAALAGSLAITAHAQTLVDTLLTGYERIQSVTCEVVKDTESAGHAVKTLSRVYFQKPDRLNVENVSPLPRRIVADGTNFYSYVPGDPKGFGRPVAHLEPDMLIPLRKVPGSAMEHLLRLKGLAETNLPATAGFPVRRGYAAAKTYAVLQLDASNRLARIEFFSDASCSNRTAQCDYSDFKEALPGVWLALVHRTTLTVGGLESHETSRYYKLAVNPEIAPNLFNPKLFFKDVPFASRFEDIYGGL